MPLPGHWSPTAHDMRLDLAPNDYSFFTDPYYPCLIQGIAQACSKQDYTFSLILMGDKEDEEKMFARVARRGFMDGILFQSDQIGDMLIDRLADSACLWLFWATIPRK
jgi:DNA-binding LacI/PurR family transcriptional regulator